MSQPLILVVEDEASLRRFLLPILQAKGYQTLAATTAMEGISLARSHNPDLMLLDLGLPDADGISVLKAFRAWSRRPVIILSARHQEQEKVRALDQGADDYLTKPFGASELMARVRVALRHIAASQEAAFCAQDLRVDLEQRNVSRDGNPIHLTPLEYRLMEALLRRNGKVATHQQLLLEVWGPGGEGQNHYLRIYMAQLRKKLEKDPDHPRLLITEPGVGYRWQMESQDS